VTDQDLDKILAVVIARAPALRSAGVMRLSADGVAFELGMTAAELAAAAQPAKEDVGPGGLDDPATYGLAPGSRVPGFDLSDGE